jgi:hypothetical protein
MFSWEYHASKLCELVNAVWSSDVMFGGRLGSGFAGLGVKACRRSSSLVVGLSFKQSTPSLLRCDACACQLLGLDCIVFDRRCADLESGHTLILRLVRVALGSEGGLGCIFDKFLSNTSASSEQQPMHRVVRYELL